MKPSSLQYYLERYSRVIVPSVGIFLLSASFVFTGYDSYTRSKEKLEFLTSSSRNRISYLIRLGDEYEIRRILNDWVTLGLTSSARIKFRQRDIRFGQEVPPLLRIYYCDPENDYEFCLESSIKIAWAFPLFNFIFTIFTVFSLNAWIQKFLGNVNLDADRLKNLARAKSSEKNEHFNFSDFAEISTATNSFIAQISELQKKKFNEINAASQIKLASQVAHDVRSPLSALEMMFSTLGEVSEDKRIIIRNSINRIRDIANSLLKENKILESKFPSGNEMFPAEIPTNNTENFETVLISPLLESIMTEVRLQYREFINLNISYNQTKEGYGLFAKLQQNELKRVLSNLINNSVEAINSKAGSITLKLTKANDEHLAIEVQDSGAGIPAIILNKLGTRGFTHGKIGGSGLGLHHAIETVRNWGGDLSISSNSKIGTTIKILLKTDHAPQWFVPKIILTPFQTIVVFDDDQSVHHIWKGRMESALATRHQIKLISLSSPREFRKCFGSIFEDMDNALYLMDYEISGCDENGLDLIVELGLQKQSILVTSRYEESMIRDRCSLQGIRLLPKSMCGFVPVEILPT